jgi:hypothetical protein
MVTGATRELEPAASGGAGGVAAYPDRWQDNATPTGSS